MGLDLVRALKAPFSSEGWIVKMLIGGILLCIPIVNFIVMGYAVKYLKNLLNNNEALPEYSNIGDLLVSGIKFFIGCIILFIPVTLVCFVISLLFAKAQLVGMLITSVIYLVYYYIAYVLMARFALDEKILSMLDFKSALLIFKDNKNLLSFVLLFIVAGLIYALITFVCCITVVGMILVPFVVFAAMLATYNLTAQFVVSAPKFEEVKSSLK